MASEPHRSIEVDRAPFTVLDWIGAACAGISIAGLLVFPVFAASFAAMYADFGDTDLPAMTHFVLRPWGAPLLAVLPLGLLVFGLRTGQGISRRRLWVVTAFVLAAASFVVCFWHAYLPLFDIAGSVSAE